jgi:hypothetical protein
VRPGTKMAGDAACRLKGYGPDRDQQHNYDDNREDVRMLQHDALLCWKLMPLIRKSALAGELLFVVVAS